MLNDRFLPTTCNAGCKADLWRMLPYNRVLDQSKENESEHIWLSKSCAFRRQIVSINNRNISMNKWRPGNHYFLWDYLPVLRPSPPPEFWSPFHCYIKLLVILVLETTDLHDWQLKIVLATDDCSHVVSARSYCVTLLQSSSCQKII